MGLATAPARFKVHLNLTPVPVFVKDLDGNYLACNDKFSAFLGLETGVVIGATMFDVLPEVLAHSLRESEQALLANPFEPHVQSTELTTLKW